MGETKKPHTAYDDVFRTLLNDCSSLIIPVINEVLEEHYSGDEKIEFSPNEHFVNQQGERGQANHGHLFQDSGHRGKEIPCRMSK